MRSFSNIMPKFATKLHLLVDSIERKSARVWHTFCCNVFHNVLPTIFHKPQKILKPAEHIKMFKVFHNFASPKLYIDIFNPHGRKKDKIDKTCSAG